MITIKMTQITNEKTIHTLDDSLHISMDQYRKHFLQKPQVTLWRMVLELRYKGHFKQV